MKYKAVFFLILAIFLFSHKLFCNSIEINYNNSSSMITNIFKFNTETDKDANLTKKYKNMLVVNAVMSITGGLFVTAGLIMGFVPIYYYNPDLLIVNTMWDGLIDYPYLTIYASIGISLVVVGTLMLLICLPFLFYSIVKLYYKENSTSQEKSYIVPKFEIRLEQQIRGGNK